MFYADRDRIAQVFLNLLTNAIKYSPDADQVDVTVSADDGFATILVKDHGIGIDEKDHLKIFERFYRVEGKSELTFPGIWNRTCLLQVKSSARHHGNIMLKAGKECGSTFKVILPIDKK